MDSLWVLLFAIFHKQIIECWSWSWGWLRRILIWETWLEHANLTNRENGAGAPSDGTSGEYPINTHYIRCKWGWLIRVPSQGYHEFPYDLPITKVLFFDFRVVCLFVFQKMFSLMCSIHLAFGRLRSNASHFVRLCWHHHFRSFEELLSYLWFWWLVKICNHTKAWY